MLKRTAATILSGICITLHSMGLLSSIEVTAEVIKPLTEASAAFIKQGVDEGQHQEEIEVNQRLNDFLAGKGIYSEEKLKELYYQSVHSGIPMDLGFLETYGSECLIQCVILLSNNEAGFEYFAMGIKNRTGERKITVVTWPVEEFLKVSPIVHIGKSLGASLKDSKFYSVEELDSFFNSGFDKMYRMQFIYEDVGNNDALWQGEKNQALYNSAYLPNIQNNIRFLSDIFIPLNMKQIGETGKKLLDSLGSGRLAEVTSFQEFLDAISTDYAYPVAFGISYKER